MFFWYLAVSDVLIASANYYSYLKEEELKNKRGRKKK